MIPSDEIDSILRLKQTNEFDSFVLPENCRRIFDNYIIKARALLRHEIAVFNNHPLEVHLLTSDQLSSDAFATVLSKKNNFLICLSYGLIANIHACFAALLSHPLVLPHIGDCNNTNCMFTVTEYGLRDFTYDHEVIRANFPVGKGFPILNYSLDEERLLYCQLLCDIAIEFCMYHEWGHILCGHLIYLNKAHRIQGIFEVDGYGEKFVNQRLGKMPLRKTMEFEADCFASEQLMSLPFRLKATQSTTFNSYPSAFIEKHNMFDAVYFSILTFFHLMQEVRIIRNKGKLLHYPAPYYRFLSMVHSLYFVKSDSVKEAWTEYDFAGAGNFLKASMIMKFDFSFIKYVHAEDTTKRDLIRLAENLDKLRAFLQQYRLKDN